MHRIEQSQRNQIVEVEVRDNLKPLCDRHHYPMQYRAHKHPALGPNAHAYSCGESNCARMYHPAMGYFEIVADKVDDTTSSTVLCTLDQTAMYLEEFEPTSRTAAWVCSQSGCRKKIVTRAK